MDVNLFVAESIPFGDEAVSTTNPKDPEHTIPDQYYVPPPEQSDEYLTMKVLFPRGEVCQLSETVHYKQGLEGNQIGQWNEKPLLDTMLYTTEFPDGEDMEVVANTAAESIFYHCDASFKYFILFKSIIYPKSMYKSVNKIDGYINFKNQVP